VNAVTAAVDDAADLPHGATDVIAGILAARSVHAVYQPIVALDDRGVVAWEALARGPEDSPIARPELLFGAARAAGRTAELDWECRAAAVRGAIDAGLRRGRPLFVNVEPEALGTPVPAHLEALWQRAGEELDVVVEITERSLTARPADLLHTVQRIRERGWRVALDDVGADTRSLALMPLLRPDVIKLDLRLVEEQPTAEIASIVNAVNAESERTGAVVLAEGIETERQLETARAMGARLGQGWLFARPGALDLSAAAGDVALPRHPLQSARVPTVTPYEVVAARLTPRRADKRLLLAISQHLENQGLALGEGAVVLSAFQEAERFTPATRRRYTRLAADAAFVAALGGGMGPAPGPGVRGAALGDGDALRGEWSIAVLGPHFAGALVAVDLGDEGADMDRRFDFCLTYDRALVIAAAATLMRRVTPLA
jgi:EAL domain-containing protein (putative c-di-GMP-specific phosphodiesterase class I)